MATNPLFTLTPNIGIGQLTSASSTNTLATGAALIFTAGTNGGIVTEVRIKMIPGTATSATAFRLWLNNGSAAGTATNNALIAEYTVPAFTNSQTAANVDYFLPMQRTGIALPPSWTMYAQIGTYTTGTFMITAIGGNY